MLNSSFRQITSVVLVAIITLIPTLTSNAWAFAEQAQVSLASSKMTAPASSAGGACVSIQRGTPEDVADAYIWEAAPNVNDGTSDMLYAGLVITGEKRSLIRFDLGVIPASAIVDSAALYLYLGTTSNQIVRVHEITAPWAETQVTWNNFGNSFAAVTSASFRADSTGLHQIDVTELVRAWMNSTPNYGLLLEEDLAGSDALNSSDNSDVQSRPRLEICYHDPTYTLTIYQAGNGSGSVTTNPAGPTFTYGTVVTLTANAHFGSSFAGWSGDATGTANPTTVTMDGNKTVTATFNRTAYILTVNTAGTGTGSVTKTPDASSYAPGTVVTLTAVPHATSVFAGWSGDVTGTANPTTLTMDGDKVVTATFNSLADLAIDKSAQVSFLTSITFTLVARNLGPSAANGAIVSDTMPPNVINTTWGCVAAGGATCASSGSGNLQDTLTVFPAGGIVTYTVHGGLTDWDFYRNTAEVIVPAGVTDPDTSNNRATILRYRIWLPLIFNNAPIQ